MPCTSATQVLIFQLDLFTFGSAVLTILMVAASQVMFKMWPLLKNKDEQNRVQSKSSIQWTLTTSRQPAAWELPHFSWIQSSQKGALPFFVETLGTVWKSSSVPRNLGVGIFAGIVASRNYDEDHICCTAHMSDMHRQYY